MTENFGLIDKEFDKKRIDKMFFIFNQIL